MIAEPVRPRDSRRLEDDAVSRARRRERRIRQELAVWASVSILILAFNELFGTGVGA